MNDMAVWFKQGVIGFEKLTDPTRRGFNAVGNLFAGKGKDLFVTAIAEGNHCPGSLHYFYRAFDFRKNGIILNEIKSELGNDFDIIEHSTHFHVEYDPKG